MSETEIRRVVREFVAIKILEGDDGDLADDTPLLALGVLNSYEIQRLARFLGERFGVRIAWEEVAADDFRDLASIARFVAARAPGP